MTPPERLFRHRLPSGQLLRDRDAGLLRAAYGRRVAHIGCTDAPLTDARLQSGDLLHLQLAGVTASLLGIDVDRRGVDVLRTSAPGDYAVADVAQDASALIAFAPDVIIASDVIEHVPDPGSFLASLAAACRSGDPAPSVVLTTPNLLAVRSAWHTAVGLEIVHDDHCLGFTPHTLTKLVRQSGFATVRCDYYVIQTGHSPIRRLYDGAARALASWRHGYADGLFVTCSI